MNRFALRGRWLVGLLVVLVWIAGCVTAARWQLRRLEEKRAHNRLVDERLAAPVESLEVVLRNAPEERAYRRVRARGEYDGDREAVLIGRALDGRPGNHLLTLLAARPGLAVMVDRGWVPAGLDRPPVEQARPPRGIVEVAGVLIPGEPGGAPPAGGQVAKADPATVFPGAVVADTYLLLDRQNPPQPAGLPRPAALLRPGEGPHLGYAVQWSIFAAVAAIGWPLLLRRVARERVGGY